MYFLAAFWIAGLVLALTPSDYVCVTYNVPRVLAGRREILRPLTHKYLSPEGLPPLIPLLDFESDDPKVQQVVRKGIAALLGLHLQALREHTVTKWTAWQNCAEWARNRLEAVADKIHATCPPGEWQSTRKAQGFAEPRRASSVTEEEAGSWSLPRLRLYRYADE